MTRRLQVLAVIGLVLALAAVGALAARTTASNAASAAPVNLTMWWWGEQEAAGAKGWLAQTVKLYERQHPNVKIKTVLQTTNGLYPAFKAAAAARKGPDIQYLWPAIWTLEDAWADNLKPVSDYIPKQELAHYLNSADNTFGGKVWTAGWYVQPSFPILYRVDVLAKAGVSPPRNWTQLLAACDKLNAKGVTPIAAGISDGWFGGWLYSVIGGQGVKSVGDVLQAVAGKQRFTDPQHAAWWTRLQELRDHDCWNKDINSVQLYQGQAVWSQGKAAMTITAGSDVKKFIDQVGSSKVGVMPTPKWGNGPYAGRLGQASQTLGITAWSKYPQESADFIRYMHTPERMQAWFAATGAFPADDRFDARLIKSPQLKTLFALVKRGSPYIENFIPTELDAKANFAQAQLLLAGKVDAKQAAEATEKIAARIRRTNRDLIKNFAAWSKSYK